MGFLDLLLSKAEPALPLSYAADFSSLNIVCLTDGVSDLLYNTAYAERCHRDGQYACSAWLHGQMDQLGIVPSQHEHLIILAKFRNGDRSPRDLKILITLQGGLARYRIAHRRSSLSSTRTGGHDGYRC